VLRARIEKPQGWAALMPAPRNKTVEKMMGAVRWVGFAACSLAAIGHRLCGHRQLQHDRRDAGAGCAVMDQHPSQAFAEAA